MKKFFSSPVHIIALVLAGVLALSAVLYHFLPQWLDLDQSPETAAAAATAQNVPKISREDLDAWAKAQAEADKQAEEERQALLDEADAFTQAVNDGNFEEALEHLDYLEAHVTDPDLRFQIKQARAELLFSLGRYEETIEACQAIFEVDDTDADGNYHYMMGVSYLNLQQYENAEAALTEALDRSESGEYRRFRGTGRVALGKYEEALEDFSEALEDGYDTPEVHFNMGICLVQLGDYAKGRDELEKALESEDPEIQESARELIDQINEYEKAGGAMTATAAAQDGTQEGTQEKTP